MRHSTLHSRHSTFVFQHRLEVGLAVAGLAAFFIRPRPLSGLGMGASLALVVFGLAGRAWAGGCAGRHTRGAVIEAPRLATGGPFAHVRNPIYLASVVLGLGMVGLLGDPWMLVPCIGVFLFLYTSIVPAEEEFLRAHFGEEYARYCAKVPRIVPRLRAWVGAQEQPFEKSVLRHEARLGLILAAVWAFLHGAAWLRAVGVQALACTRWAA